MEIDPYLQFRLFLSAFCAGLLAGAFWELLTVSRILLGAYRTPERLRALYQKKLPLLSRPIGLGADKNLRRVWRTVLVAAGDLLFSLGFAALVIIVLYLYNDGGFRMTVPVLALAGFALFHFAFTRLFGSAVAYFAFGVAALRLYVSALLHVCFLWVFRVFKGVFLRPVTALFRKIADKRAIRITQRLCRKQLVWASKEFETRKDEAANGKRKKRAQADAPAMGGSHADSFDIHRGGADRRRQIDGMESGKAAPFGGAKKKRRA